MSIDGTWKIAMETPMGTRDATLVLTMSGSTLAGQLRGDGGGADIYDGMVSGNKASWKADITQPMPLTLEFSTTVEGDKMSGNVKLGMFGNAPLTGDRT